MTELIASASQELMGADFEQVKGKSADWETPSTRLFENRDSIVGLAAFETCGELLKTWTDSQGSLVDLISRSVGSQESKSWDGYLVLLTPAPAIGDIDAIDMVRYNTSRLRKLVATGTDLRSPGDVVRVLRPLLPLRSERVGSESESALDLLPQLLAADQIPKGVTQLLVNAYQNQESMLERLHARQDE
jgi:hypothetical protein